MTAILPHFKKLCCDFETPVSLYSKLASHHAYAFLLESAEQNASSGRYSFIGFEPLFLHISPAGCAKSPLEALRKKIEKISYLPHADLPQLQAGFVGYFSYETARHFEKINLPTTKTDIPEAIFFFPKNLLVFDHLTKDLTLIAYSKKDLDNLAVSVEKTQYAKSPTPLVFSDKPVAETNTVGAPPRLSINCLVTCASCDTRPPLLGDGICPWPDLGSGRPCLGTAPALGLASLRLGLDDKKHFEALVISAKERICAGEIFQVVLCREFRQKTRDQPFDLYRKLRLISPSPYMYFLKYPDFSIIGSSPETLIKVENDEVILRPIAGTRRRGKTPQEDCQMAEELRNDVKEQAEHMMLVDLGRNDVGRVAVPGSVKVTKLMATEKYSHVMHLVSEIRGRCNKKYSVFDVFKAAFPAGTLTGAPRIRAMEIIAELEKRPRGIYGGAVGYFDLSGNMDFAIAIRTMLYKNEPHSSGGKISLRAGAGIVYDSLPDAENRECLNKARAPLTSLSK